MSESEIGRVLLDIGVLLALTYLLGGVLGRLRVPPILGALFVAMGAHYSGIGQSLTSPELRPAFGLLADLGVMFLLFFIGLQIDVKEMRSQSGDIVLLTVLNTTFPFLLGAAVMLALGYGWVLAFVIGLTRMPTAEAVIVPILDEFGLIKTRVGRFIVGAGVLDDVIEIFLVAFVSVWIGEKAVSAAAVTGVVENDIARIILAIAVFVAFATVGYLWVVPLLSRWLPRRPANLTMLSMVVLFGLGGFAEVSELGAVVGAITAGVVMRPAFNRLGRVGEQTTDAIRAIAYGLFGLIFFFWIGLAVDLKGMVQAPTLAILLFLAAFLGKLIGVYLMVPMKKLAPLEAGIIGIGINARLTTEIIVAKLLLDAQLINAELFTALIAASSLSTILVPFAFTLMIRQWRHRLGPVEGVAAVS